MLAITVKIEFAAAKRLLGYEGKCAFLHGYRHAIEASFSAENLNDAGMAVDFYAVRKLLQDWVDENWDHNLILNAKDKELGDSIEKITSQKIFYLAENPTAENMAEYLFQKICPELIKDYIGLKCVKLRLYDNPGAWVEISG